MPRWDKFHGADGTIGWRSVKEDTIRARAPAEQMLRCNGDHCPFFFVVFEFGSTARRVLRRALLKRCLAKFGLASRAGWRGTFRWDSISGSVARMKEKICHSVKLRGSTRLAPFAVSISVQRDAVPASSICLSSRLPSRVTLVSPATLRPPYDRTKR